MGASLVSPLCPQKLRRRSSPSIQQDIAIGLAPLNRMNAGYAGHPLDLLDSLILIPRTRLSRLAQVLWLLRHASLHHHPRFCVPTPGLMQMERLSTGKTRLR